MKNRMNVNGFTLIEALVSLTLLGVTLGALYQIFLSQAEAYKTQAALLQRQQGMRAALELIARDTRSTGYPLPDQSFLDHQTLWLPNSFIPKIPQSVIPDGVLTLTSGGNNPDTLSLLIVLPGETNPTNLAAEGRIGDTSLTLALTGSETNDQFNTSDLVYLGKPAELAQVKEIKGNVLVIDTDPLTPGNQGLKKAYPTGTEIGEISLVSYAVFNDQNDAAGRYHDPGIPVLKRKINAGGFEPLAEGISDFKVSLIKTGLIRLQLSAVPCQFPIHPRTGQGKSITLSTQVWKRN